MFTEEQKDKRRVQNRAAQKRYRDRNKQANHERRPSAVPRLDARGDNCAVQGNVLQVAASAPGVKELQRA